MGVVLIGGGARSGKSRFALDYAQKRFHRPALIATAQALDRDMKERIRRHQAERDPAWSTIEEPIEITAVMAREAGRFDVFVVDCLTLWLSNILHDVNGDARAEIERLKGYLERLSGTTTVLVTNEVGCGIVPDTALARDYRDLLGECNQTVGRIADEVYWMVFGMPVPVKGSAVGSLDRAY